MSIEFYGIPNCDTVKKARAWLDQRGIGYTFHDYKKEGADPAKLRAMDRREGLGNGAQPPRAPRSASSIRRKPPISMPRTAVPLMQANPSTIKRPVVEYPGGLLVGFDAAEWERALGPRRGSARSAQLRGAGGRHPRPAVAVVVRGGGEALASVSAASNGVKRRGVESRARAISPIGSPMRAGRGRGQSSLGRAEPLPRCRGRAISVRIRPTSSVLRSLHGGLEIGAQPLLERRSRSCARPL